jgi:hypothetical protein
LRWYKTDISDQTSAIRKQEKMTSFLVAEFKRISDIGERIAGGEGRDP